MPIFFNSFLSLGVGLSAQEIKANLFGTAKTRIEKKNFNINENFI
jgi:hypothetical protein